MNQFNDIESIPLPEAFARVLLSDASCEAVLVESTVSSNAPKSWDSTRVNVGHRGSVTVFRVGRAYVAEIVDAEGTTRTVGLAPTDAEAYVQRADRDDDWTVLTVDEALSSDRTRANDAQAATEG